MSASRPNLYRRLTASVPLLVTVIVHVVLAAVAGYFVVSEQILGKKKTIEAPPPAGASIVQKQVEHRLQVARRGGGAASASPVSATRIFSTASDALQMPAMPELPQVGASALGGMGFGGAGMGAGLGTGTGFNTGLGAGSASLGRGFMTMSFLGMTNQRVSRVVFVVDVGRNLLDIRKGGFEAFTIIREEIMKLVSRLPPGAEFGVVLYENGRWRNQAVAAFDDKLVPATVANKQAFFDWIKPVNATPDRIGLASAPGRRLQWKPREVERLGIDPELDTPDWSRALHFALEMEPDTVFVISGAQGTLRKKVSEAEMARREREHAKRVKDHQDFLKAQGLDGKEVAAARSRAFAKARAELDAVNRKLRAQGKSPFIVTAIRRVFHADFQAALRKAGFSIRLDTTGWTDRQGRPVYSPGSSPTDTQNVGFNELILHVSKLQRMLPKGRATLNYFLFVGPNEEPKAAIENLSQLTRRNDGRFELLTTRRLQELTARDAAGT